MFKNREAAKQFEKALSERMQALYEEVDKYQKKVENTSMLVGFWVDRSFTDSVRAVTVSFVSKKRRVRIKMLAYELVEIKDYRQVFETILEDAYNQVL